MITKGLEAATRHILEDVYCDGETNETTPMDEIVAVHHNELLTLIRAEAINLADQIIGKDRLIHSLTDSHGDTFVDPVDKAIFDFQVKQRIELAKYHNPPVVEAPEELTNTELSENEA